MKLKARDIAVGVTKNSIILEPDDMTETGALTDASRKALEQQKLSQADILKIDLSSQAVKQLTNLCKQELKNSYLTQTERAFINVLLKEMDKTEIPVVDAVKSVRKKITAVHGMGERIARFLSKCIDVFTALFSKKVSAVKEVYSKAEDHVQRMQNFKNRFQQIVERTTKDKAELLFMQKFEAAYKSPEIIEQMVLRRQPVRSENYTLKKLEQKGYFDQNGNLKQPPPKNHEMVDMDRINREVEKFCTGNACQTDREKIILASVIYAVATEVGIAFLPEIIALSNKMSAPSNHQELIKLIQQHKELNEISACSEKITDFIKQQVNTAAKAPEQDRGLNL